MPSSSYQAPAWLPGGHLQTLYPYFFAPKPRLHYRRERWELPDGDFLDLDWLDAAPGSPLLVLFHGLEGNAQGFYILALVQQAQRSGMACVVVNFRGCSGEANRLPRAYFAGDSAEIGYVLTRLRAGLPDIAVYAVGYSLGGNALLLWLGEQGAQARRLLTAAASVSAPLNLTAAGNTLDRGLNRWLYTRHFLRTLKRKTRAKLQRHPGQFDARALTHARTFRAFDNLYTAPVHGFLDAEDYWRRAASLPLLSQIRLPTLLINARNDPFMPGHSLPREADVSPFVTLDFPATGGHVGFPTGAFPGRIDWLPQRIVRFLLSPAPLACPT